MKSIQQIAERGRPHAVPKPSWVSGSGVNLHINVVVHVVAAG
jgi:hypothetical protein